MSIPVFALCHALLQHLAPGGPRVTLRLSGTGAARARDSGTAYDLPWGGSCTGTAGNCEIFT